MADSSCNTLYRIVYSVRLYGDKSLSGEAFAASLLVQSRNFYGRTEKNDEHLGIVGDLADTAVAHLPDL
jgi:hypothetical protein